MRRLRALVMGIGPDSALVRAVVAEAEAEPEPFATEADLDRLARMGG